MAACARDVRGAELRRGPPEGQVLSITKGRYRVREAADAQDIDRAQALRHLSFRAARGLGPPGARDSDAFDAHCLHVLVEDLASGALVCCFRLMPFANGAGISRSYAAQFYDLAPLSGFASPMMEVGRFCTHPDWPDPDILRLAWAGMTRLVDAGGVAMLFGCSSFEGVRLEDHAEALALLKERHLGPRPWQPLIKATQVYRFAEALAAHRPDARQALLQMPPLLRTYLLMGGWVSDHAVMDPELDTLHVFTGLEIAAIPPARARALRALAA